MTQTASETAHRKVTQIIGHGADSAIVDAGYERRWALGALNDYATHPRSTDLVTERAEAAIEQLSNETDEEASDE